MCALVVFFFFSCVFFNNFINIYITLHYTTLHYTTLHYTTLHYTTLHYTTLHYTTLHYTTLHYTTLHYTTLHYTTLHYTTLHYITLHYITFCIKTINKVTEISKVTAKDKNSEVCGDVTNSLQVTTYLCSQKTIVPVVQITVGFNNKCLSTCGLVPTV